MPSKPTIALAAMKKYQVMLHGPQVSSDEMRAKMVPSLEPLPLVDYMYQHLAGGAWRGFLGDRSEGETPFPTGSWRL